MVRAPLADALLPKPRRRSRVRATLVLALGVSALQLVGCIEEEPGETEPGAEETSEGLETTGPGVDEPSEPPEAAKPGVDEASEALTAVGEGPVSLQKTVQFGFDPTSGPLSYNAPTGCTITDISGAGQWSRWNYDGDGTYWQGCNDLSPSACATPMSGLNASKDGVFCDFDSGYYYDNRGACTYTVELECNGCPEAAPNRWPSNGKCYVCPEGQIKQDDGNGGASCEPRCQGLTGAALTACSGCSIDGGIACRCNQLAGPEQALCTCLAFGGGQACYPSPTCSDAIKNQSETGVDCGGPCTPCPPPPTCSDAIKNQSETGVDCGGPCTPCPPPPTCSDQLQNQGETGIDCGGPCAGPCVPPPPPPTCADGLQNQSEKGIDCGGPCAGPCPAATCSDGVQNQNEVGIDCGGACAACTQTCQVGPVDPPTGFGPIARPTALSVGSVNIQLGKMPRRAGDRVTFKFVRKACPTLASLAISGSSGAKTSTPSASGTLTFVAAVNDETYSAAVPVAKQASGWVYPYRVCPANTTPATCPANITDTCGPSGSPTWLAQLDVWEAALTAEIKLRQPLLMLPNALNALPVQGWIINDAMVVPPVVEPAPVATEVSPAALAAAEATFEAAISTPGAGPFTPADLFRLALDASGCPLGGECSNAQYLAGVLAGHNVLKHAASVLRNTAPCGTDAKSKAWMLPNTLGSTASERVCTLYTGYFAEGGPSWQGDLIRKLPVARRILTNVVNLRPACYNNGNWLGPNYHVFAMALVDWYSYGLGNNAAGVIEYVNQYKLNYVDDWPYLGLNLMQARAFAGSHGLGY